MKILNKIVWDIKEPTNLNDIWYDNKKLHIYKEGKWESITENSDINFDEVIPDAPSRRFPILYYIKQDLTNVQKEQVLYNLGLFDSINSIANKVDKVEGKGLSSNDFTNAYKGALDGLDEALSGKQDTIADLDVIRSKANSALQEVPDGYVKEEDVSTINGQSILNGGNIEIQGSGLVGEVVSSTEPTASFPQVLYIEQTLTEEQKSVARMNIGVDTYVAEVVADKVDATYVNNAIASAITNVLNTEV